MQDIFSFFANVSLENKKKKKGEFCSRFINLSPEDKKKNFARSLFKICFMKKRQRKHMGSEYVSREKKLSMVNFLIFVQKNVSTIRFQEIKIRPFKDFEKMRFLCFYIIKSMARKGYFGPKSDFRGSKIPPRGASST